MRPMRRWSTARTRCRFGRASNVWRYATVSSNAGCPRASPGSSSRVEAARAPTRLCAWLVATSSCKGRPERWKVVGRHPSYHGMTLGTIAVASHSTRQVGFEPLLLPFPKVPWNDPEAVVEVIEREGPETIAGFIAEPITGAAGACLTASDDYWRVVTEICHRYDILLITDEVMCGYGRTGLNFGFQHFPFEPDVIVGGKGLGGGYVPMGAVAARTEVAEALTNAGFMYFTFTGNDAACAASVAVLDIMEREGLVERAAKMGAVLGDRLHAELDDHPRSSRCAAVACSTASRSTSRSRRSSPRPCAATCGSIQPGPVPCRARS